MPATTIKLDSELVKKVAALKPKGESLSGYVRGLIEREHQERLLRGAARSYEAFLRENPAERAAMEVWESAPLTDSVEPGKP
jgi:predicted CopG family antitoxin